MSIAYVTEVPHRIITIYPQSKRHGQLPARSSRRDAIQENEPRNSQHAQKDSRNQRPPSPYTSPVPTILPPTLPPPWNKIAQRSKLVSNSKKPDTNKVLEANFQHGFETTAVMSKAQTKAGSTHPFSSLTWLGHSLAPEALFLHKISVSVAALPRQRTYVRVPRPFLVWTIPGQAYEVLHARVVGDLGGNSAFAAFPEVQGERHRPVGTIWLSRCSFSLYAGRVVRNAS